MSVLIANGTVVSATGRVAADVLVDGEVVVALLAPGMDADIVVWDPAGHTTIGLDAKHHMNTDFSPYEGFEIDGAVDTVISRGSVVVADGAFHGRAGHGCYVRRGHSQYLR